MKFSLNASGRLSCQGLGVVKYNKDIFCVVGTKELDSCIRRLELDSDEFIVTLDTRGTSYDGSVVIGTYTSILAIMALSMAISSASLYFTTER